MQDSIRDPDSIIAMTSFVKEGGIFTLDNVQRFNEARSHHSLLQISQFPTDDSEHDYVHDGHHRSLSIYLGGRKVLHPEEYQIHSWSGIESYSEVNRSVGWVTPFDVRTEMRLSDIHEFKAEAMAIEDEEELLEFIKVNRHRYCKPRTIWTLEQFASSLRENGVLRV